MDRGVGLSADPATLDIDQIRSLVQWALNEPRFTQAAQQVRTEIAAQPSPATVIERITAALR